MLIPEWVGLCTLQAPVGLSNNLSCEAESLSCCPPLPPRAFSIRGLRVYFPRAVALGCMVCFAPRHSTGLSMRECGNVGPRGATHCSACPALRHSESGPLGLSVRECGAAGSASGWTACTVRPTLRQSHPATATRVLSTLVPVSAPPTGLDEYLFFISLVSDPLAFRFSFSSGCWRRHSVSTYAAILVLFK